MIKSKATKRPSCGSASVQGLVVFLLGPGCMRRPQACYASVKSALKSADR
jgi:hypothetical protein